MQERAFKVFLDGYLTPPEVFRMMREPIYIQAGWTICRNFEQFQNAVKDIRPSIISFAHDLNDEHLSTKGELKQFRDMRHIASRVEVERLYYNTLYTKCGYHAAAWLVDHCITFAYPLPQCFEHGSNKIGGRNIIAILDTYEERFKETQHAWEGI